MRHGWSNIQFDIISISMLRNSFLNWQCCMHAEHGNTWKLEHCSLIYAIQCSLFENWRERGWKLTNKLANHSWGFLGNCPGVCSICHSFVNPSYIFYYNLLHFTLTAVQYGFLLYFIKYNYRFIFLFLYFFGQMFEFDLNY